MHELGIPLQPPRPDSQPHYTAACCYQSIIVARSTKSATIIFELLLVFIGQLTTIIAAHH